jgi:hypothetical protein
LRAAPVEKDGAFEISSTDKFKLASSNRKVQTAKFKLASGKPTQ